FIAQVATLLLLISLFSFSRNVNLKSFSSQEKSLDRHKTSLRNCFAALILSTSAVAIAIIPWLRVMQNHLNRSETNWLPTPQQIEPLYQTLISWIIMVIILPVEKQPLPITIISGLIMLLFAGWLGWKVFRGIKLLLKESTISTLTLLSFTSFVLLGILTISYILGKDITVAPRYNFVYYPSFSALIAASLIRENRNKLLGDRFPSPQKSDFIKYQIKKNSLPIILLVGFISSTFVVSDLAFQKPYLPQQVAQNIYQEPSVPIMAVMAYRNSQDVALGLSFALALERETQTFQNSNAANNKYLTFAFLNQTSSWESVFEKLSILPNQNISQLNLWIFAPGRVRRDFSEQIKLSQSLSCNLDTNQYYRIGIPYQLYRCQK
ncbi:MAG: hypothetical protein WBA41_32560, partial [Rivularia sp. (in: cyanobacteria)]